MENNVNIGKRRLFRRNRNITSDPSIRIKLINHHNFTGVWVLKDLNHQIIANGNLTDLDEVLINQNNLLGRRMLIIEYEIDDINHRRIIDLSGVL